MSCSNPLYLDGIRNIYGRLVPVPCRHCLSCRVDSITMWNYRIMSEYISHPSAFVTVTYDDNHLHYVNEDYLNSEYVRSKSRYSRHDFGVSIGLYPTLRKEDFTKYIDDLRHYVKKLPDDFVKKNRIERDFKYVCAGEYGDSFNRPHGHFLFMGLDFQDCSKLFKKFWPHGSVKVLPILNGGIRYVLKYFEKNQNDEFRDSKYFDYGLENPFISFSKGIGLSWFRSHYDEISRYGMITVGSRRIPVPPYFRNMFARYDLDYIDNKFFGLDNAEYNLSLKAHSAGYVDVNKFVKDSAIARETNLLLRSRSNGSPVYDYLTPLKKAKNKLSVGDLRNLVMDCIYSDDEFNSYCGDFSKLECAPF